MNIGNLELTFNPVGPNRMTENDRTTFIEGMRNLIDLDAVLVVASGNIHVSTFLKFPPTSNSDL